MSERGSYSAIRSVLLDGKDFRCLGPESRWVFVALKMNFGAAGIDVWYRNELTARLAGQTGYNEAIIDAALLDLEHKGWVSFEDNVVWIIGHVTNDPHIDAKDAKHRKSIQKHVAGLPRLDIVRAFVGKHPEWIPEQEGAPMGLGWAFQRIGKGKKGARPPLRSTITNNKEQITKNKSLGAAGRTDGVETDFAVLWERYPERAGSAAKHKALIAYRARRRENEPHEVMVDGVERYRAFCEATDKVGTSYVQQCATFLGPGQPYREEWKIPDKTVEAVGRSPFEKDAQAIWRLLKTTPLLNTNRITFDADVQALVADGKIKDPEKFRAIFEKLDINFLRSAQSAHFAVQSIIKSLSHDP